MPIKTIQARPAQFTELGRIRKGAPKNDKGEMGREIEYFRADFFVDGLEPVWRQYYDDRPTLINVIVPFDPVHNDDGTYDMERFWWYNLTAYTRGGMCAKSDGVTYDFLRNPETGEKLVVDGTYVGPQEWLDKIDPDLVLAYTSYTGSDGKIHADHKIVYDADIPLVFYQTKDGKVMPVKLEPEGRLRVIVPELRRAGYMTVMTGGWNDISNITEQLTAIYETFGKLRGVPLILTRRKEDTPAQLANGKRVPTTHYNLHLEVAPWWFEQNIKRLEAMSHLQLPEGVVVEGQARSALLPPEAPTVPIPLEPIESQPVEKPGGFDFHRELAAWGKAKDKNAKIEVYWTMVYRLDRNQQAANALGNAILEDCDNDFDRAFAAVVRGYGDDKSKKTLGKDDPPEEG